MKDSLSLSRAIIMQTIKFSLRRAWWGSSNKVWGILFQHKMMNLMMMLVYVNWGIKRKEILNITLGFVVWVNSIPNRNRGIRDEAFIMEV